jgi:hypothetical protein
MSAGLLREVITDRKMKLSKVTGSMRLRSSHSAGPAENPPEIILPDDYLDQLRPEDRAKKYDFCNLDPLRVRSVSSLNPGPLKIIGTHLSARAVRIFSGRGPKWIEPV